MLNLKNLFEGIFDFGPRMPNNYHLDWDESKNRYFWYYLGRKEGSKDYESPKYFIKSSDAIKDAIKHYNNRKKKK